MAGVRHWLRQLVNLHQRHARRPARPRDLHRVAAAAQRHGERGVLRTRRQRERPHLLRQRRDPRRPAPRLVRRQRASRPRIRPAAAPRARRPRRSAPAPAPRRAPAPALPPPPPQLSRPRSGSAPPRPRPCESRDLRCVKARPRPGSPPRSSRCPQRCSPPRSSFPRRPTAPPRTPASHWSRPRSLHHSCATDTRSPPCPATPTCNVTASPTATFTLCGWRVMPGPVCAQPAAANTVDGATATFHHHRRGRCFRSSTRTPRIFRLEAFTSSTNRTRIDPSWPHLALARGPIGPSGLETIAGPSAHYP